ncbi:MAG: transcriptional repressor [Lachnospiraceae bacterium]|nr:transcriptional repressor [Lachnospiraceae bacterium]MDD3796099.1 transcriptional repressor [Lachnospiraceae bacterium]
MLQDLEKAKKQASIIQKLRDRGCRITKQRQMILDIILEEDCTCCKEIYYKAARQDKNIGSATVYRMINTLEEIGAISRKNTYQIACEEEKETKCACTIEFEDDTVMKLSEKNWSQIIQNGLTACGYRSGKKVKNVITKT